MRKDGGYTKRQSGCTETSLIHVIKRKLKYQRRRTLMIWSCSGLGNDVILEAIFHCLRVSRRYYVNLSKNLRK